MFPDEGDSWIEYISIISDDGESFSLFCARPVPLSKLTTCLLSTVYAAVQRYSTWWWYLVRFFFYKMHVLQYNNWIIVECMSIQSNPLEGFFTVAFLTCSYIIDVRFYLAVILWYLCDHELGLDRLRLRQYSVVTQQNQRTTSYWPGVRGHWSLLVHKPIETQQQARLPWR